MRRRDISLCLAICLSLAVHGWLARYAIDQYVAGIGQPRWWERFRKPPAAPQTVNIPPTPVASPPPEFNLGETNATGDTLSKIDLPDEMLAPQANQRQAFSRIDAGSGAASAAAAPAQFASAVGLQSTPPPMSAAYKPRPKGETLPPAKPAKVEADADRPARKDSPSIAPPTPADDRPQQQQPPSREAEPQPAIAAASGGERAPKAETDSDLFAETGSAVYRAGKTEVRLGRQFKLVKPDFNLASRFASIRTPCEVKMILDLDDTGVVKRVQIIEGSGSEDIDQAIKLAAYKWWIEPTKDRAGRAVASQIAFTYGIR